MINVVLRVDNLLKFVHHIVEDIIPFVIVLGEGWESRVVSSKILERFANNYKECIVKIPDIIAVNLLYPTTFFCF